MRSFAVMSMGMAVVMTVIVIVMVMTVIMVVMIAMIMVMVMAVRVIMAGVTVLVMRVSMRGAGIGATLGVERRLDLDHACAEPLHHRLDDVIPADAQTLRHDLRRQMAVAE